MAESVVLLSIGPRQVKCQLLGNDLITEAEEMCKVIRENLKAAQSRQKSYCDSKHRDVAFEETMPTSASLQ